MIIPFSPPDITEREISAVADALRSGWITTGQRTKTLERRIAERCGVSRAVCLNSQTACAEMALRLLGVGEGDEVITTAYTYTATASVVCHVGARLVLVDTKKDSPLIDCDKVADAINENTKAIIPVDLAGIPAEYDRLFSIVEEKKSKFKPKSNMQSALKRVAIVADAAHAFGSRWRKRAVGSIADFSAFSFHAVKNLTTGEGGVLTWRGFDGIDDEEIYKALQLLSLHGQSKDALTKTELGSWEYDVLGTWYKCNMTDVAAAIGLSQMDRYPQMLVRRREIIERYDQAFRPFGIITLDHYTDEYESSGHLYITRVPKITANERNEIIKIMAQRGIACNVHYKPLPMHTAYKQLGFDIRDYPNAYDFFENEITLPLHTSLTDEMVELVIENYIDVVREYIR